MLTPWKESYDQPRQHIKKQRHYFANKGPSSQGNGFSSGHVWIWELDYKESWALKNWCFWTVVLEKTLESPLDSKEIKPVNTKGNQAWIFIGKTDAEAPIFWSPDTMSQLTGKDPDAGKDWRQTEKDKYHISSVQFSSLQSLSHVWLFVTPLIAACQASLSITNSQSLLKLMSIKSVMLSNHLILCHPLLLLPSIFPSIRVFFNESVLCIRWLKYWSFSISPSNEYSGRISFRMDWLDLLAVQGTLESLLQHHSSKASILPCSAFFTVQLSHLYMTTGKNHSFD